MPVAPAARQPIIGDSMDLARGRQPGAGDYPSRVIEGFGQAILDAGQDEANPLAKRAVSIHTGIGRGHAHQDTLNIEIFAHGCRLAPDLGGRHAGRNRSSPNMRRNRMHNVVWVDDAEFHNPYAGSTTAATGWTTAFSPIATIFSSFASTFENGDRHSGILVSPKSRYSCPAVYVSRKRRH